MLNSLIRHIHRKQEGITGLETAIILIAFVMVASIFSYVVVTAGLFSSQKAREAVQSGLDQSRSSMELKGFVVAKMDTSNIATNIIFTLGLVPGGVPVDVTDTTNKTNRIIITYADAYHQYSSLDWKAEMINANNGDSLLDPGELVQITVDMAKINSGAAGANEKLSANHAFVLEIKPPDGPVLTIERTIPARLAAIINLY